MCLLKDHKRNERSPLWVELHKFQQNMEEKQFVKLVMLFLVMRGEAVALLQISGI